jgi:hypothetical protein
LRRKLKGRNSQEEMRAYQNISCPEERSTSLSGEKFPQSSGQYCGELNQTKPLPFAMKIFKEKTKKLTTQSACKLPPLNCFRFQK